MNRNSLVFSKLTWGIWQVLTRALQNLKDLHFNGLLLTKIYNAWAKEVQINCVWWNWMLMQNFKEKWLGLPKWHEECGKFSPEHVWKSKKGDIYWVLLSKVGNAWASNLQGSYVSRERRMMQNLNRNSLVSSKLIWGIWGILTRALKNPKNLHFNGLFLTKIYNVWAKKDAEELSSIALKIDAKFEGKLTGNF